MKFPDLRFILPVLLASLFFQQANAQKIVYSEKNNNDARNLNFEIIGKINGNFLIYKNTRARSWISLLDNDMQPVGESKLDFLPNDDRMINVDFFPYTDHAWMIYQYQRRSVVYCMAARIDGMGKKIGELIELDTTHLGFAADNFVENCTNSVDVSMHTFTLWISNNLLGRHILRSA